jgi:hypothetical protein
MLRNQHSDTGARIWRTTPRERRASSIAILSCHRRAGLPYWQLSSSHADSLETSSDLAPAGNGYYIGLKYMVIGAAIVITLYVVSQLL